MRALRRRRIWLNTTTLGRRALFLALSLAGAGHAEAWSEAAGTAHVCAAGPQEALARAEQARGEAAVSSASLLPNPALVAQQQGMFNGAQGQETIVGVNVPLGLGGQWFLGQDAARARRDAAFADARATRFESALAFRMAYVAAAVAQARVEVLTEQQAALDAMTATVDKLSQGGEAAAYDFARQQTQARLHRRLLESARADALRAVRTLEQWTGEPGSLAPVALADLAGGAAVARNATMTETRLPRLQSLEAHVTASAFDAEAAGRRWIPDPELFAGYRTTSAAASEREHGVALWLNVPLPFFDHGQGEAAAAAAQRDIARSTAEALRRQSNAEREAAASQLAILEASLPEVEQTASEAMAQQEKATRLYSAGESTITELIDAFRTAEEARLARVELALEIAGTRLSVMRSSGSMFDTSLDEKCRANSGTQR